MAKADSPVSRPPVAPGARKRPKATVSSRYLLPLATAVLLGACFVVYYLTYVQQHREYLLNRDYRVLATLGEQMSETLANQTSILTSYVETLDYGDAFYHSDTYKRTRGQPDEQYYPRDLKHDLSDLSLEVQSFGPRLNHVQIRRLGAHSALTKPGLIRRDGEWSFQLAAVDTDGDAEASATITLQDISQSFSPSITEDFDDVLIADNDDKIVFQTQRIGPHFSSLSDLVGNAIQTNAKQSDGDKDSNSKAGSAGVPPEGSGQLIETEVAGVSYLIFLEPVTIDVNPSDRMGQQLTQSFTLVGLAPSRRFNWQSLAIPYQAVILFSSGFLLICLGTPIGKIFFLNERGRLRLPEIVLLPLLFVTIAAALTIIGLQTTYLGLRHDGTDQELSDLSEKMRGNILQEITAMREQLMAACLERDFQDDLRFKQGDVIRTNVLRKEFKPPQPLKYPYFSNFFWTDSQGRQMIKWTPTENATPLIDVSHLDYFLKLDSRNEYFFLGNNAGPRFRLDSILPPNQDEYVGVLGMRMSDCIGHESKASGFAFMSARPLSLIEPILPLGVGFALVDDTGKVLFHSDKHRNNRENILVETSNDRELTASLYGHSNQDDFPLDYRGTEVWARVVSVSGVYQSPWSLIVYKDTRYEQTHDLEVLTMAGALLIGYLGLPALIVFLFYLLDRPRYVPDWLWPSESVGRIYRFQIAAGAGMLVLSAALTSLRPIEESLYAAAASGYATVMIVYWSAFRDKPWSLGKTVFAWICRVAAIAMVAFAIWNRWWGSISIGLILLLIVFPSAWERRVRPLVLLAIAHVMPPAAALRFARLSYWSLYNIRAVVLLTVVGILPSLSFFRNSVRLEDRLYVRAAQLHAARSWNLRNRKIESLFSEIPEIKDLTVQGADSKQINRCETAAWDFYLGSYFDTDVRPDPGSAAGPRPSDLGDGFLRFAHALHHSFNAIGAEALGVLRNPALPEPVYAGHAPPEARDSSVLSRLFRRLMLFRSSGGAPPAEASQAEPREWEWEWVPDDENKRRLHLRVHEGADVANICPTPDKGEKTDLVVSSAVPTDPVWVSAGSYIFTWLAVTAVMSLLFWLVTRKIFLFGLGKPLSQSAENLLEALKGAANALVLTTSRQDWSPELAGGDASRIDVRALAAEPNWGEKFDATKLPAGSTVVVENFDWELATPESNRQRLILTERVIAHSRKLILVSAVDPSPFLIEPWGPEPAGAAGRWAAVLGAFTRINLGSESSWVLGEQIEKELPTLWQECRVQPDLQRIGEELWLARNPDQLLEPEQIVSEVGERAVQSYYLEWRSSTEAECFVLAGLARDGTVNPRNTASLRQLLRRGLIVRDPQFRIMNESFRRFVLAHAVTMQEDWDDEAAGSGWGKVRGPLATALVLVGLFLLSTQQQFLQTSSGLLTAAGGFVAVLLRLIGAAKGKSSNA